VFAVSSVLFGAVLYRFPDGRFVPRASALALLLVVGLELIWFAGFVATGSRAKPELVVIGELALFALSVIAQVYRYRRVSTPVQRQQTKWAIFGASVFLVALGTHLLPLVVPRAVIRGSAEHLAYALVSISAVAVGTTAAAFAVAVGVLRYRLFDIDLIINRALVYGAVTAILAGSFAGLSAVAQYVVRSMSGQHSEIVSIALAVVRGCVRSVEDARPEHRGPPPEGLGAKRATDGACRDRLSDIRFPRWRTVRPGM